MLKHLRKVSKGSLLAMLVIILLTLSPISAFASQKDARDVEGAQLYMSGKKVSLSSPLHMVNGRLYMPIAQLVKLLSGSVNWNGTTQEATVTTKSEDEVVFGNGVPVVYYNQDRYKLDDAPYMYDERMYVPVRHAVEILHGSIDWDAEKKILYLDSIPLVEVNGENSIQAIAEQYSMTTKQLLTNNEIASMDKVKTGAKLKVIIPSVLGEKASTYTEADYLLLAKLVMVESGYESYEGQLAVANVILNRVNSGKFPSTIKDVIYAGRQFPPAHNGLLDKSEPNSSVLRATKDALNGKNNVGGAVYFFNPKYSTGSFWSNLTVENTIGNHRFAK